MRYITGIVSQFGGAAEDAEHAVLDAIAEHRAPDEPSMTNRFLQALEMSLNAANQEKGVLFSGYAVSSMGPNADEAVIGADFLAVLNIDMNGMSISKGFLCQAKRETRGFDVRRVTTRNIEVRFNSHAELQTLQRQTDKMLRLSPDSFVCIYSGAGFVFIPAVSVAGFQYGKDVRGVYGKNVKLFFQEFLMCFIGDTSLGAHDPDRLHHLAERVKSRYAILMNVKSVKGWE